VSTTAQTPTAPHSVTRGARTALIAIGGNALVLDGESGDLDRQQARARAFAKQVAGLVADGWTVVVTHGNGPQVGYILRRGELVAPEARVEGLPDLPLWLAVADSQGGIGHLVTLALDEALTARGLRSGAVALLTHVEVDPDDPAFTHPTKPIGGVLTAEVARRRVDEEGWHVTETSAGVFRRVVPSPQPQRILEADHVATLVASGATVVAAGGGGIPIVRGETGWRGVDAVIDKDRASAVLAATARVATLVLVTGVDAVCVDFGTPAQRALDHVTADELRGHLAEGQFPPGSMGPKVEAALRFLDHGGTSAVITSLPNLNAALGGDAGTHITTVARSATKPRS
jgi:carbamate kinase